MRLNMMSRWRLACLAVLLTHPASAEPPHEPEPVRNDPIVIRRCVVSYERSAMLGTSTSAALQDCLVELGQPVKAKQPLGHLDDREFRASMALHALDAASEVKLKIAESEHEEMHLVVRSQEALRKRGLSVDVEYATYRARELTARLKIENARHELQAAKLEYQKAEAQALAREIVAPYDGIIVGIFKKPGEVVRPDEAVFHLVDVHRVWVTGLIDVRDAWRTHAGQAVTVTAEVGGANLSVEKMPFPGKLIFVDPLLDLTHQTCKVIAAVDNPSGMLRAGLRARMEIAVAPANTAE